MPLALLRPTVNLSWSLLILSFFFFSVLVTLALILVSGVLLAGGCLQIISYKARWPAPTVVDCFGILFYHFVSSILKFGAVIGYNIKYILQSI